jgi:hypothetical protein
MPKKQASRDPQRDEPEIPHTADGIPVYNRERQQREDAAWEADKRRRSRRRDHGGPVIRPEDFGVT